MSFFKGPQFSGGVSLVFPRVSYQGINGEVEDSDSKVYLPFHLYGVYPINEKLAVGLSVNTPFGLGSSWAEDWSGRYITQEARVNCISFQPSLSYKLSPKIALGGGFILSSVTAKQTLALPYASQSAPYVQAELKGNDLAFGYNLGLYFETEKWSLGLDYRSQQEVEIGNGEAEFSQVPASLLANGTLPSSAEFSSRINLPSVLSTGLAYRINSDIVLSLDLNFTSWSVYDSLNFTFSEYPQLNSSSPRLYEDAFAVRLGLLVHSTQKLDIRAGLAYDQSPVRDAYVSPELPDNDRIILSAGCGYRLNERFRIDAALVYEDIRERNEEFNIPHGFNGRYKSNIFILGLGFSYEL